MAEGKVTIGQVYDTLIEVRDQLKTLNGTVRANCTDIAVLQERVGRQGTNSTDIAVLQEQVGTHNINWDRLVNLGLAIIQVLLIAKLMQP